MVFRINERAINSALATILNEHGNLPGLAEATTSRHGGSAPDIRMSPYLGSRNQVVIEAKVGTSESRRRDAIADAQQRFEQWDNVHATIALCYPDYVAEVENQSQLMAILRNECQLHFVEVNLSGAVGNWQQGDWSDLCSAITIAGEGVARSVVDTLSVALDSVLHSLAQPDHERIAKALDLPGEVRKDYQGRIVRDERGEAVYSFSKAAKIGALLLVNGALMQTRLRDTGALTSFDIEIPSVKVCIDADSPKSALWDVWQLIRKVDYHPIYDAALKTLDAFPDSEDGRSTLQMLGNAVLGVAARLGDIRADLAGRIYHRLLDTARFDGSFYTSTPAAILLSRLALPSDYIDWSDANRIANLRICDPSCGTGTLLMAVAQTCHDRHLAVNGKGMDDDILHLAMVEDVLNGMDINLSAVHLAASMLALSNPKVDFNKMGIYRSKFGVERNGGASGTKAWLGSLEMLQGRDPRLQFLDFERSSGDGEQAAYPPLHNKCDLVIMNPPFTRDSLRHDQLSREDERLMRKAERKLLTKHDHGGITDLTSISPMFTLLADELCKKNEGTFAKVMPATAGMNTSGLQERIFYNDHWHVETVITSHDPNRIFFSENTNIHESLMIARRRQPCAKSKPTKFINLTRNPGTAFEALGLSNAIVNNDITGWGSIQINSPNDMERGDWLPMVFYNGDLTQAVRMLRGGLDGALKPIGELANVAPDGRVARGNFRRATVGQSPDMRALWFHKSEERTTMQAAPDCFIAAKPGKEKIAARYWKQRSKLVIANRIYPLKAQTVSVFSTRPVIGSAWVPVTPLADRRQERIMKSWCVWANSSAGIIEFLAISQKKFTYPAFSLDGLRSLPFPDPVANPDAITALAEVYDNLRDSTLLPLPQADKCDVRSAIDTAVSNALGRDMDDIHSWRRLIAIEPNVCQQTHDDPSR